MAAAITHDTPSDSRQPRQPGVRRIAGSVQRSWRFRTRSVARERKRTGAADSQKHTGTSCCVVPMGSASTVESRRRARSITSFRSRVAGLTTTRTSRRRVPHVTVASATTSRPSGSLLSSVLNVSRSCKRYYSSNAAQVAGWVVLRFTPQQLASGDALPLLKEMLT